VSGLGSAAAGFLAADCWAAAVMALITPWPPEREGRQAFPGALPRRKERWTSVGIGRHPVGIG